MKRILQLSLAASLLFAFCVDTSFAAGRGAGPKQHEGNLKVGMDAPDFTLKKLHAKNDKDTVQLSTFEGKKPVMLIFGSYT